MSKKELMEMTKLFVNGLTVEDITVETTTETNGDNFQAFTVWFIKEFNSVPTYADYQKIKERIKESVK